MGSSAIFYGSKPLPPKHPNGETDTLEERLRHSPRAMKMQTPLGTMFEGPKGHPQI